MSTQRPRHSGIRAVGPYAWAGRCGRIGRWEVHQEAMMNLAIWHPRKVQSATIYQVTDRSHDGRTARVPGDEITSTVSGWLSELGTQSPLADELARAVRIGDWPAAYAIGEHLSVEIAVAV
ncbi:hypothetical protein IZ84_14060 [Mycobacterium tuberculosis]|nr:hypothetical protein IZ84_14060 [Mycobacterium tuberculosis]AII95144.1 hypothetical protein JE53_14045 [Mycobacterium tuberculosis]